MELSLIDKVELGRAYSDVTGIWVFLFETFTETFNKIYNLFGFWNYWNFDNLFWSLTDEYCFNEDTLELYAEYLVGVKPNWIEWFKEMSIYWN